MLNGILRRWCAVWEGDSGEQEERPPGWTAVGAARAAREARIATVQFLRQAPSARSWQASKLLGAYQVKLAHLDGQTKTAALLPVTGMDYSESWHPGNWMEAAKHILADEAHNMASADLYILSPQMRDVVIAAAQTLTWDDVSMLTETDLPSPSGLVVLPHPVLVRAVNDNVGDDRAYLWHSSSWQRSCQQTRDHNRTLGFEEERVIGEYTPGTEISDPDDSFTTRFLYAFWRLCDQRIATTSPAEVRHAARVTAERAGVSLEVRVVQLRPSRQEPDGPSTTGGSDWHHRWVVRMHKCASGTPPNNATR
jgi:hypothetical protein